MSESKDKKEVENKEKPKKSGIKEIFETLDMKKVGIAAAIIVVIIGLVFVIPNIKIGSSGSASDVPNANRGTDYTYDYINYLDISFYGPNGEGIIEVTPADYSSKDFTDENEYIQIKRLMDTLNLTYINGEDNSQSHIYIDETDGLSNGDIVTVGISSDITYSTDLDINLENYQIEVTGLTEGKEIDLFNDDSVIFYGLDGTNLVGYIKTPKTATLPQEIEDYLDFTVTTEETDFVANKTIIHAIATMDEDFLLNEENPYYNLDIYMKKHGYKYEAEKDTVLDEVIVPITFNEYINPKIYDALISEFYGKEVAYYSQSYVIDDVCNIQQYAESSGSDAFTYIVTFHAIGEGDTEAAFRASMMIEDIDENLFIENVSDFTYSNSTDIWMNPISSGIEVKAQYYYPEVEEETAETVETEATETAETTE